MLTDKEQLRYSRHLMLDSMGMEGQLALKQSTALIIGLGGLGNPVAMYLAAAGVGKLILADGDKIELSNLQRQILYTEQSIGDNKAEQAASQLLQRNSNVEFEVVDEMLSGEDLEYQVSLADIVIDCTDNLQTRQQINKVCVQQQIPLVVGAAIRTEGQLLVVDSRQNNSACYQCLYPQDEESAVNCQTAGVLSPILGIIGSMQALTAINILTGQAVATNQLTIFDGLQCNWQQFNLNKQKHCPICS